MPRNSNTKQLIERAALELFVSQGITETRTRQIAEAVKISEGTIYRHFTGKDEIARELFERQHIALARALESAAARHNHITDQAKAIVTSYCDIADKDWLLFRFHQLSQPTLLRFFENEQGNPVNIVVDIIKSAMDRGELRQGNANLYASMSLGIVLQAATFKAFGRLEGPLSAHIETFSKAVTAVLQVTPNQT